MQKMLHDPSKINIIDKIEKVYVSPLKKNLMKDTISIIESESENKSLNFISLKQLSSPARVNEITDKFKEVQSLFDNYKNEIEKRF